MAKRAETHGEGGNDPMPSQSDTPRIARRPKARKPRPADITDEMAAYIERRLDLVGGSTPTEIGADLANRFPMGERVPRKEQISSYSQAFLLYLEQNYGSERRANDGRLLGYGDQIRYDGRQHFVKGW